MSSAAETWDQRQNHFEEQKLLQTIGTRVSKANVDDFSSKLGVGCIEGKSTSKMHSK